MARKSLGYVELEWTCPSCHTRNPGTAPKCLQCNTAQPEDVKFEQAPEEKLITDETKIAAAKAGPDIYCAYCGTRNPATATACKQCAAPLGEGKARAAGEVLGGLRTAPAPPVKCPACGADNPAMALKCANCGASLEKAPAPQPPAARPGGCGILPLILLGLALLVAIFFFVSQSSRRDDSGTQGGNSGLNIQGGSQTSLNVVGQISGYSWRRVIAIEALAPVTREGWQDELPAGVETLQCRKRVYQVVDEPVPGAREVCGTPYVIDRGNGLGEVVQDCQYEILADYCQYRTFVWTTGPPLVLEGRDQSPAWPDTSQLTEKQRAGRRSEEYRVTFQANDRAYTYTTDDETEYQTLIKGGSWNLRIGGSGQITGISQP